MLAKAAEVTQSVRQVSVTHDVDDGIKGTHDMKGIRVSDSGRVTKSVRQVSVAHFLFYSEGLCEWWSLARYVQVWR